MDKIIAELPKGPLDKLVISVRQYEEHTFVDPRLYFLGGDEQWHSTKKGVTVSPSQGDEFMTAVGQVQAHLPPSTKPRPRERR
ncbi:MAG: transcriptional coactivator p15/PC4 family protein [Nitrospinae bacterium]|nr:transcriptional coactivator p15/PC4 family protein [Nitrospinota bacterium]